MNVYEAMFLLDNQVVREDWKSAKRVVTDLLEKHGAEIASARRWDERKLAYTIRGRRRGTYLLTYFRARGDAIGLVRRDVELEERILRYLLIRGESVPASEIELSKAELAEGFTLPPPPPDDEPVAVREAEPVSAPPQEAGEPVEEVEAAVAVEEEE